MRILFQNRAPIQAPCRYCECYARRYLLGRGAMVSDAHPRARTYAPSRFRPDTFHEALKISARAGDLSDIDWGRFKYIVFDIPTHKGAYQERYSALGRYLPSAVLWTVLIPVSGELVAPNSFIEIAPMEICKDTSHLEQFYQAVMDRGGEGIILRDPNAVYQPGRCPGYLKHKVGSNTVARSTNCLQKFRDAEAKIVGPAGAYQWECELYVLLITSRHADKSQANRDSL